VNTTPKPRLSPAQLALLDLLSRGPIPWGELRARVSAQAHGKKRGANAATTNRLVRLGLIEYTSTNGRWRITPAGRKAHEHSKRKAALI
jgi:DNA-binding IclR family transcriptional regulator